MNIKSLVRQKVIGNVKIGKTTENGLPQKLPFFNVEEDKITNEEMVKVFKQLYGDKPQKIIVRFVSENFFTLRFKRYTNKKAVCIGNGSKAITIGKDSKGNPKQMEIECLGRECEQLKTGKCKLKGSIKFVLDGIDAGGVWNLSTTGGDSLSNIATEIIEHNNRGESMLNVPFELWLTEKEHLVYGKYYVINIKRKDFKPKLTVDIEQPKQLSAGETGKENISEEKKIDTNQTKNHSEENNETKQDFTNYLIFKKSIPTLINNSKFDKIIFENINGEDVEYILHPKANKDILKYGMGTVIELTKSTKETDRDILCSYNIKQVINEKGELVEFNNKN